MVSIKLIIDNYKWDPDKHLNGLRISYVHRGAANDTKYIRRNPLR